MQGQVQGCRNVIKSAGASEISISFSVDLYHLRTYLCVYTYLSSSHPGEPHETIKFINCVNAKILSKNLDKKWRAMTPSPNGSYAYGQVTRSGQMTSLCKKLYNRATTTMFEGK